MGGCLLPHRGGVCGQPPSPTCRPRSLWRWCRPGRCLRPPRHAPRQSPAAHAGGRPAGQQGQQPRCKLSRDLAYSRLALGTCLMMLPEPGLANTRSADSGPARGAPDLLHVTSNVCTPPSLPPSLPPLPARLTSSAAWKRASPACPPSLATRSLSSSWSWATWAMTACGERGKGGGGQRVGQGR